MAKRNIGDSDAATSLAATESRTSAPTESAATPATVADLEELIQSTVSKTLADASRRQDDEVLRREGRLEDSRVYQSIAEGPLVTRRITDAMHPAVGGCECDRGLDRFLPKHILSGDFVESCRGDRPLSSRAFQALSADELRKRDDIITTLYDIARKLRLEEPEAREKAQLHRIEADLANRREILKSLEEGIRELEIEQEAKQRDLERAGRPLQNFLAGHSEAWREALAKAESVNRDVLPKPEKGGPTVFGVGRGHEVVPLNGPQNAQAARAFQLGPTGEVVAVRVDRE